jgi:hypothetical protein
MEVNFAHFSKLLMDYLDLLLERLLIPNILRLAVRKAERHANSTYIFISPIYIKCLRCGKHIVNHVNSSKF